MRADRNGQFPSKIDCITTNFEQQQLFTYRQQTLFDNNRVGPKLFKSSAIKSPNMLSFKKTISGIITESWANLPETNQHRLKLNYFQYHEAHIGQEEMSPQNI